MVLVAGSRIKVRGGGVSFGAMAAWGAGSGLVRLLPGAGGVVCLTGC